MKKTYVLYIFKNLDKSPVLGELADSEKEPCVGDTIVRNIEDGENSQMVSYEIVDVKKFHGDIILYHVEINWLCIQPKIK